jgi:septum formation protein
MMRLVLASGSPRRRELLGWFGHPFDVVAPEVDETPRADETPIDHVSRLALDKVRAVAGEIVVAADTTVDVDGDILGKPVDAAHAKVMLTRLSGRGHRVHTAVAVRRGSAIVHDVVTTEVRFVPLDDAAIAWYTSTGEPMGKAGAYAIQGAGGALVAEVRGSVSNVVGLPLAELVVLARRLDVELFGAPA